MDVKRLIELVKEHPVLYDKYNSYYCDRSSRDDAWKKISKQLPNTTSYSCREKWSALRECYRKALLVREKNGFKKPSKYEEELSFVKPHLAPISAKKQQANEDFLTIITDQQSTQLSEVSEEMNDETKSTTYEFESELNDMIDNSNNSPFATPSPIEQKPNIAASSSSCVDPLSNTTSHTNKAIHHFFLSMADTVKHLPFDLQIEAKKKVFEVITDCEITAMKRGNL